MFNGIGPNSKLNHDLFMMKAFHLAEKAFDEDEVPVGAVVVHENRIVGQGYNQVERLNDPTAHAEMIAISAACDTLSTKYLSDCTLYVTLEPCAMCSGAIVWAKLKRVVFGALDEKAGGCGSLFNIAANKKLNHQTEIIHGVMEMDCQFLLNRFFRSKR
jgi:tRNA(adenine34) deaminase